MAIESARTASTSPKSRRARSPRVRTGVHAVLVLGGMLPFFGCLSDPLELQPLTITLEATPLSAAVGEEIEFSYTTRGSNLEGTVLEYGNGESETVPYINTGSAPVNIQTQGGRFDHAYAQAGTFTARATVTDRTGAAEFAEVTIQVTSP